MGGRSSRQAIPGVFAAVVSHRPHVPRAWAAGSMTHAVTLLAAIESMRVTVLESPEDSIASPLETMSRDGGVCTISLTVASSSYADHLTTLEKPREDGRLVHPSLLSFWLTSTGSHTLPNVLRKSFVCKERYIGCGVWRSSPWT